MKQIDVVGFGAMNIDRLYQVDEIVLDGEQLIRQSAAYPGGSAANTSYGLAKLGIKTGFVGAVGTDDDGKRLVNDFDAVAVDTGQIRAKQLVPTGSTICLSDKAGKRAIYVAPGANDCLSRDDVDPTYLNSPRVIHMSSFAGEDQFNLQIYVTDKVNNSVTISLSPGMFYVAKGFKALAPLLEKANFVFINRDEIERLTGKGFRAGAERLIKLGCQTVVVTLGRGLVKDRSHRVAAYIRDVEKACDIVSDEKSDFPLDTTGAGDAFSAGFLFGWLRGKPTKECGLLGDIIASFAVSQVGSRAGLPTLAQLSKKYLQRSGKPL